MDIYIIIVTYNAMPWIDRCLTSLRQSTIESVPVVIDNASSDGSVEYIQKNYPEVVLFPQKKNLGFGQANNIGFKYALEQKADYVLLLNQDAALHPDALELLLQQSDGKSLFSPLHCNGDGSRIDYMVKNATLLKAKNTLVDDFLLAKPKQIYEIGEICAACWLMPVSMLRTIGGFNPLFFHYGEDNNYYQRLKYHGIPVFLVPQALMFHDREVHGNMTVYKRKWIYRRLLFAATNINLSLLRRIESYMEVLKDCYVHALWKKQYVPGLFACEMLNLLLKYRKILFSRKQDVTIGSNWL